MKLKDLLIKINFCWVRVYYGDKFTRFYKKSSDIVYEINKEWLEYEVLDICEL